VTAAAARAYAALLRQHIEKEDPVLFETARSLLTPAQAAELLLRFERFDTAGVGGEELARLAQLAHRLATPAA